MRLKLIACEVMYREFCHVVAAAPHTVDVEFAPKGLHDLGATPMRERLQTLVDAVPADRYEAILLGYALCNNGVVGLTARHTPLIIPRAHDCIALFMGSRRTYEAYFYANPGVYFTTAGWLERGAVAGDLATQTVQRRTGMDSSYEELVAKYGEENAQYLWETLCNTLRNYSQYTFIEMGIEPDDRFELQTQEDAARRGWRVDKVQGDMRLFRKLVAAEWDEDEFLVVPPGHAIAANVNETIMESEEPGK
jgi:hypothetical protein